MLSYVIEWLLCSWLVSAPATLAAAHPQTLVRVNGEAITDQELQAEVERTKQKPSSDEQTLERLILYKLAIQQAKQLKLDKLPETQQQIDRILYQKFLEHTLSQSAEKVAVTPSELKARYAQFPILRLRHLVLLTPHEKDREVARITVENIEKALKKGTSFKDLVLRYSQDESRNRGGDLDYQPTFELEQRYRETVLSLKQVGQVSRPLFTESAVHFFELLGRKSLEQAPATYRQLLEVTARQEKENVLLKNLLADLKIQATIEKVKP